MKRRLIILCSIVILALVSAVVYRERSVREIGLRVIQDYQPIIDKYIEGINGREGQCPAMTAEEMMSFSRFCGEKHCLISACMDDGFGGHSVGLRVKAWSGTGGIESIFSRDSYSLGYVDLEDGSRRPSVRYVRRFSKDGHAVKLTLIAWPDDVEVSDFVGGGGHSGNQGIVDRIFSLGR
jgi:hypothetical protein